MGELNKKKVAVLIIAVLLIIGIITTIIILTTKGKDSREGIATTSEFQNMKIDDVVVTYDAEKDTTYVNFKIKNKTANDIDKEAVNIEVLDEKNTTLAGVQITIEYIEGHGEYRTSLSFLGDLTSIKKVSLDKPIQST